MGNKDLIESFIAQFSNIKLIAEGGQKKVYSAEHPDYGSVVIKSGEYGYSTTLDRISREVNLLKVIESKYYPKNYEFIVDRDSRIFVIVEERLDAVELTGVKNQFSTDLQIRHLLNHLICALNILWQQNVVHRDVKPANILITPDGEPRVIDLGIARILDDTSLTATMAFRGPGTPIYAAPEQLSNQKAIINYRTDFFLLGILVLELMHGFHPFDPKYVGNQDNLVTNIVTGKYVRPDRSRDEKLIGFVERVLQPKPYQRFRTVDSLMNYLELEDASC